MIFSKHVTLLARCNLNHKICFYLYLIVLIIHLISLKRFNEIIFKMSEFHFNQQRSSNDYNFNPLITIAIPLYNKISFLERLTLSILQYTNTERNKNHIIFEMVVVDANSDDGSFQFFENLVLILNGTFDTNTNDEFINKYHLKQFAINNSKYFNMSFSQIPFSTSEVLIYDRSCIYIHIYRQKKKTLSSKARQICVEKSNGIFIWQVDPDDMVNTPFVPDIVDTVSENRNTDIIEFSFYYHLVKKDGSVKTKQNKKKKKNIHSNHEIVEQFLTNKKHEWQLWQCIVRREIYLKAIQTIKKMVPDTEKVYYASDLFFYIPITYHSNSYISISAFGYHYFYRNNGSVSLLAKKGKIHPRGGKRIVFGFLEALFNNSGIPIPPEYQAKNI